MGIAKDLLKRLPSVFNKDVGSNVGKLITVIGDEIEEIWNNLNAMEDERDIDKATGKTLDYHGQNVQQKRKGLSDERYRDYIKVKIASNMSGGEIETIIEVTNVLVNGEVAEVKEGWKYEILDKEDAAVMVVIDASFPADNNYIPFSAIDKIAAGGVRVYINLRLNRNIILESKYKTKEELWELYESDIILESEYRSQIQRQKYVGMTNTGEQLEGGLHTWR